jgi:hypothetical protein
MRILRFSWLGDESGTPGSSCADHNHVMNAHTVISIYIIKKCWLASSWSFALKEFWALWDNTEWSKSQATHGQFETFCSPLYGSIGHSSLLAKFSQWFSWRLK